MIDAIPVVHAEPIIDGVTHLTTRTFIRTLWNAFANLLFFAAGIALTIFTGIPVINIWLQLGIVIAGCFYNAYLDGSLNRDNIQTNTSKARMLWFSMFLFLGYVTAPFIMHFMVSVQNAGLLMAIAGLSTITLSLALIGFAYMSYSMGATDNKLLWAPLLGNILLGLLAASIMNIFFHIPVLTLLISIGTAVLYSFYLVFDVVYQLCMTDKKPYASDFISVQASANIALDILNIFISILKIMAFFNSKDGHDSDTDIVQDFIKIFTVIGALFVGGAIVVMGNSYFEKDSSELETEEEGSPLYTGRSSYSSNPYNADRHTESGQQHHRFGQQAP